jgi:hypothetical protein
MLLVSRHITGGFYELEEEGSQIEKFNPVSLMTGKTYWRWSKEPIDKIIKEKKCAYPYGIFRYSSVSGRYDTMSFVRVRQMHRCSIPHFEEKDSNQDRSQYIFPSFLTRREFGIKIDLNFRHNCDSSKLNDIEQYQNIITGYISVVLKRRSLRLPFLARLLASAKVTDKDAKKRKAELTKYIHEEKILSNYLRETDTALLMDGSADFLLILRKKDETEDTLSRLDAVMNLAYWLHQDFMVDRTEIILASSVVDSVAKDIFSSKYEERRFSLECDIHCFEDRFLDYRLDKIKEKLICNIEESQKTSCKYELLVTFEITAGSKDFVLRFFNADVKNLSNLVSITTWKFNEFREDLERLLAIGEVDEKRNPKLSGLAYIDRIEVHVNKNPPTLKDELSKQLTDSSGS